MEPIGNLWAAQRLLWRKHNFIATVTPPTGPQNSFQLGATLRGAEFSDGKRSRSCAVTFPRPLRDDNIFADWPTQLESSDGFKRSE
jgi:hypothetical protein